MSHTQNMASTPTGESVDVGAAKSLSNVQKSGGVSEAYDTVTQIQLRETVVPVLRDSYYVFAVRRTKFIAMSLASETKVCIIAVPEHRVGKRKKYSIYMHCH